MVTFFKSNRVSYTPQTQRNHEKSLIPPNVTYPIEIWCRYEYNHVHCFPFFFLQDAQLIPWALVRFIFEPMPSSETADINKIRPVSCAKTASIFPLLTSEDVILVSGLFFPLVFIPSELWGASAVTRPTVAIPSAVQPVRLFSVGEVNAMLDSRLGRIFLPRKIPCFLLKNTQRAGEASKIICGLWLLVPKRQFNAIFSYLC